VNIKVKWYQPFYLAFFCICFSSPFYSVGLLLGAVYSILLFIVASLLWVHAANYAYDYFLTEFKKELEQTMRIQEKAERNFAESTALLKRARNE